MKKSLNFNIEVKISAKNATQLFIKETTTDRAISALKALIAENYIFPDLYNTVRISYDTSKGLGYDTYPVVFSGEYSFLPENERPPVIFMSGVTAGYAGEGPHGTLTAMELMGFNVDDSIKHQVLSRANGPVVNFIYTK